MVRRPYGAYQRRAAASNSAMRIAGAGAGRPVNMANWCSAWVSSRSRPETIGHPAACAPAASGVGQGSYRASNRTVSGRQATFRSSATPLGTVEMTRSARAHSAARAKSAYDSGSPRCSATGYSAVTASGRRAYTVTRDAPRSRDAARAARAVPPAPRTATVSTVDSPTDRSASTIPGASVLSAPQPWGWRTNVFAAPNAAATGVTSSATTSATSLSGMVNDSPAHSGPRPATRPASSASAHSIAVYRQPVSPAAAYPALCSTGDSECAIGLPRTAARRTLSRSAACPAARCAWTDGRRGASADTDGHPGRPRLTGLLADVGVRLGERRVARRVDGQEVVEVRGRRVDRGAERVVARVADRSRRQPRLVVGVVRVVRVVQLRLGQLAGVLGRPAADPQPVVDRTVQPEAVAREVLVRPVVEHPGHPAHVLREHRLHLRDRGDDQRLVRRDSQILYHVREVKIGHLLV